MTGQLYQNVQVVFLGEDEPARIGDVGRDFRFPS